MSNQIVTESVCNQVLRVCREQIASRKVKAGEQFPSERDLAEKYGISRATANKVIASLIGENLLLHRKGIGTFVTEHRSLHLSLIEMESFTMQAESLGLQPSTEVLEFMEVPAGRLPPSVLASLAPEEDERFYYGRRLRLAGSDPVLLEHRWLRASLLPGLKAKDLRGSLYTLIRERYHLQLFGEQQVIDARAADAETARLLQVKNGAPLLVVEGPGFLKDDKALWHQVLLCRSDRYCLENRTRSQGQSGHTHFRLRAAAV